MAFNSAPGNSSRRDGKRPLDLESMISGLLSGITMLGFAACLLLVLNGKAQEWIRNLSNPAHVQTAEPGSDAK